MKFLQAIAACIFMYVPWAEAQLHSISGIVKSETGEVLPGAYIHLHELEFNTITNKDGEFMIADIHPGFYHLHINYLGFESITREFELTGDLNLKIELRESHTELDEVVVETEFMNSDEGESSQSFETYDQEKLINSASGSFVNALENKPGVSSINTGVGIAKPVIRGMSFNRVLVNDNGVKQEGQQWGSDHGLGIDQFKVQRVELLKGPSTLIYGSDALGGSINILPPAIPINNSYGGELRGIYRSNNSTYGGSAMAEAAKNDFYTRLRFSYLDFGDYQVPASEFTYNGYNLQIENERLKNTAGRERNADFTIGLRKRWGNVSVNFSRFDQHAGLFPGAIGIPRAYNLTDDGDPGGVDIPKQHTSHNKVGINSSLRIGGNWLEIQMAYQYNRRREYTLPHAHGFGPVPEGNLALDLQLHTLTWAVRYKIRRNEKTKDVIGFNGQYQENEEYGYEHLLSPYSAFQNGLFFVRQHKVRPSLTLNAGLRLDYSQSDISEFFAPVWNSNREIDYYSQRNEDIQKEFLNYSASAGFSWFPFTDWNVKANLGRSFRIPTAAELSINGVHHGTFRHELGNQDLNSEKGYQLDLGLVMRKKKLDISFSPFLNYFEDYIYLSPTSRFGYIDQTGSLVLLPEAGQTFQYSQNNAIISGFEFLTDYHLVKNLHYEIAVEYVYKYNLDTDLPLPFTPPPSIQNGIDYSWRTGTINWNTGLQWKRFFDQNNVDRNEKTTPGFDLFSVNAGVKRNFGKRELSAFLKIRNVFDQRYFNHLSRYRLLNLPEQGRDIIIQTVFKF